MQSLKKALKKLTNLGRQAPAKSSEKKNVSKGSQQMPANKPTHTVKKAAPIKKKSPSAPVKNAGKQASNPIKKAHAHPANVSAPSKKPSAPIKTAVGKASASGAKHSKDAKDPKDAKKKVPSVRDKAGKVAPERGPDKTGIETAKKKTAVGVAPPQSVTVSTSEQSTAKAVEMTVPLKSAKPLKKKEDDEAEFTELAKKASVPPPAASVANVTGAPPSAASASEADEVVLTDADGRRYCRVKDCDQAATVESYCRYHYLLFWKNIQNRKKILSEGKLERYVEELTARYPDKFLELLRKDLRSEKDFTAAIQELEIDDSSSENEFEDEAQSYLDEVRGMSSESTPEREEEF